MCGRGEVCSDLNVGSHNEKYQWEWIMMLRCVWGGTEVYNDLDVGSRNEKR